jgi:hypothetical protein
MKHVEILIQGNGATLKSHNFSRFVDRDDEDFSRHLDEFTAEAGVKNKLVTVWVSENVLFFKNFELPVKTQNLKEAVSYQLNMIIPFPEDSYYYSYTSKREGKAHKIQLYAVQRRHVDVYLQGASSAGYTINGLFPEGQRYLTGSSPKENWALFVPGHPSKILVFSGQSLADRLLFHMEPELTELQEATGCEAVYHRTPPAEGGYRDANLLLGKAPFLKEYNLLPSYYRQPDYFKMIIVALAVLNIVGIIFLGGLKINKLRAFRADVDSEIAKIMPTVEEVKKLQEQEKQLSASLQTIQEIGQNYDFIRIFQQLTQKLPPGSYLDQVRMDKKTTALVIQGYTDDIGSLTTGLQGIGDVKLKSTSRRKDKTYFQLEITLS